MRRTRAQVEANDIDFQLYSIFLRLERFAEAVRTPEMKRAAISILAARRAIRQHMHPQDVKETAA